MAHLPLDQPCTPLDPLPPSRIFSPNRSPRPLFLAIAVSDAANWLASPLSEPYCSQPASRAVYVTGALASQLGTTRTNVGSVGQIALLYWAIASTVACEINLPPHLAVRCGSSIRKWPSSVPSAM